MEGYSYDELKPLVTHCLKKGVSVLVKGHPGIGKSDMAKEIADELRADMKKEQADIKLPFIDIRLAQSEPSELAGLQVPNRETKTIDHYRPWWVPVEEPAFIMLDEINSAVTKLHQSVAYQIVLEKRIGPHIFAHGTVVMAAGNQEEDNAIVTTLSSALNNRFAHFVMRPDVDSWLRWAERNQLPADIRGWVALRREKVIYDNNGQDAFPTPRSIARAGTINGVDDIHKKKKLVSACIGEAHATDYIAFLEIFRNINLDDIFDKGVIPGVKGAEPSFLYALIYACVSYLSKLTPAQLKKGKAGNAVKLLIGLEHAVEYQIVFLRMLLNQKNNVLAALQGVPEFAVIVPRISHILTQAQ